MTRAGLWARAGTGDAVRIVLLTLAGVLLIAGAYLAILVASDPRYGSMGYNFAIYRDAAARWLGGGPFYYLEQVNSPYMTLEGHVLYPPTSLILFLPFVYLPSFLWWAIPVAIVAWRVWALRPALWAWPVMAACLAFPATVQIIWAGNPVLWIVAALALATRWPWVSVFVFLKPSLFPFAFLGVRTRAWWLAAAMFGVVSLVFLPLWPDWIAAVLNARGPASGLLYSLRDVPFMAIPVVAWWARCRSQRSAEEIHRRLPIGRRRLGLRAPE